MTDHFRGRLEVFGLADLLQWMELNRRSGRLTVTRGHDRRTLDWKDGEIVYVSGSLPRHRLGVHLLRSGALPAATLYELLARNMTTQENLTRLILEMGHDTLDGLSLRVEELARKLLFEIFEWREANFEYDPTYRVTPILRIGLTLRGQALAFQGVKQLDDTHRLSRRERRETWEAADAWVIPFLPEGIEEHFWEALERIEAPLDPPEGRGHAMRFHEFARRLRDRLIKNYLMRPVHHDTAALLAELLKKTPLDPAVDRPGRRARPVPDAQPADPGQLSLGRPRELRRHRAGGPRSHRRPGRDRPHRPALLHRLPRSSAQRSGRARRAPREPRRGSGLGPVRRALRHLPGAGIHARACSTASGTPISSRSCGR